MSDFNYYQRNRDVILNKAKDYWENDKEGLREQARDKYRNLSEGEKNKKKKNIETTDTIIYPKKRRRN